MELMRAPIYLAGGLLGHAYHRHRLSERAGGPLAEELVLELMEQDSGL